MFKRKKEPSDVITSKRLKSILKRFPSDATFVLPSGKPLNSVNAYCDQNGRWFITLKFDPNLVVDNEAKND